MSIDRRHQVFVSSTYEDLREERHEVIQALLELDCIPAGMELFPATDDDQWSLIRRVIDECDYYIVIIGGRYGSIGPQGFSYTEQEYRYALQTGKPILAFLHKTPSSIPVGKTESKVESQSLLGEFRSLVQKKVCKYWETPSELGSGVSRSLVRLIKTHPMPGWVRADKAVATLAAEEMLRLRRTIDELQEKLSKSELEGPEGGLDLAQGEEVFPVKFTFSYTDATGSGWDCTRVTTISWNDIFQGVGSLMFDGLSEEQFREILNRVVESEYLDSGEMEKDEHLQGCDEIRDVLIDWRDEQTIKIQFRALGLIEYSKGQGNSNSEWRLTPFGDSSLLKLCAIRKNEFKEWEEVDNQALEDVVMIDDAPVSEPSV
ncbi:DUF4062 domain-containing protein [Pseudomonas sp. E6002]|uniref:DUF4062 domain-containing protein n=1 Tax=Pseudomonas sp. E6002 TaxID=2738820 RepID=UPI001C4309BF|nr:DUF4062 domain-containing protein [Pseudomonas sp. E6002]